ncbi:MAG: phytanoyl-CoA dioxygenase family protein [Alphaproteobacteria bacterium]|nr:phytanoyl-CoA dioxygenase family protein [Alphaproteobacteria bacterium]
MSSYADVPAGAVPEADAIARYRRDGFLVLRGVLGPKLVRDCIEAIGGLASGRIPRTETEIGFEPGVDAAGLAPDQRQDHIRKFAYYVGDAPALMAAAMAKPLHDALDRLVGTGRVLFQDMALIKPPRIGGQKDWHQDAAYFRVSDARLIVGSWIALDPASRENGCMEVIPGSHLLGPTAHVAKLDPNQCHIRRDLIRADRKVAIELAPGDALIFSSLIHHYTAPNTSGLRRRALQFHFNQLGMDWTTLEDHRRDFHDERGEYAGCTVQPAPVPPGQEFRYRSDRAIPIVPRADWG